MSYEKYLEELIQQEGLEQSSVQAKCLLVIRHAQDFTVQRVMSWALYMIGEKPEDRSKFLTTVGYRFANMPLSTRMVDVELAKGLPAAIGDLIKKEHLEEDMDVGGLQHPMDKIFVRDAFRQQLSDANMVTWA